MIPKRIIPLLPVISGLLLAASWPERGIPLLLFIAFVPLLLVEEIKRKDPNSTKLGLYWLVFPAFFIWNALTTWWIYNATFFGAAVATLLNAFSQSLMFWLFYYSRKTMKRGDKGYIALIFYWITFEFIHHHWDLNWPWMTLGNGFAAYPQLIQWYEYTGAFGGSLWVLVVNILIYKAIKGYLLKDTSLFDVKKWIIPAAIIIVPIAVSIFIYSTYEEKHNPINVVVVQPNFDPYEEQYELPAEEVIRKASQLALIQIDSTTDFVVFPESMVQPDFSSGIWIWENSLDNNPTFPLFRTLLLSNYPNLKIVTGYSTYKEYHEGDKLTSTARRFREGPGHYDAFNTAFLITRDNDLQLYHKSKLTPGVELMPFQWLLSPLGDIAIDLGGTVGGLGTDKERRPFTIGNSLKIAPVICYESAYGEFVNGFMKNNANAIFIITNDGWWGNTPGHRQHMLFSVIRSIETRRSIARSANTGISCFVNQRGDVLQRTNYWEPAVIKGVINANDEITFYVRYGDLIARACTIGAVLLLLVTISNRLKPQISRGNNM